MRKETSSRRSPRKEHDWEQGRRRPEIPIRAYLAVILRDPQAVIRALRAA
jgi:DNA-binding transcriptional regulator YiaG